jgi:hypothetical protein
VKDRIGDYLNGNQGLEELQSHFFSTSLTGYLIQNIMNRISITRDTIYTNLTEKKNEKEQNASDLLKTWYISDLLSKSLFTKYMALHSKEVEGLKVNMAPILKRIKLKEVREYFGEEIALFFAWVQFYTEWCGIVCIPAIFSAIWSLATTSNLKSLTVTQLLTLFDNSSTIIFALSLNLCSLLFVKYWKRRNHYLAFLWDVDSHPDTLHSERRTGWTPSTKLHYSPINGEMIPWEESESRLARRITSAIILTGCIVLLCAITAANVILLAYTENNSNIGISFIDQYGKTAASVFVSALAAVFIVIIGKAIDVIAQYLVDLENHRTLTSHLNHFIWIQFIINFINSYGLMIFSAIIRPLAHEMNPNQSYLFGSLGCLNQGSGDTCMSSLVLSVSVIFLVQQFLLQILGWSYNFYVRKSQASREKTMKYPYEVDKHMVHITTEKFEKEYVSKTVQLGYLVLFSSAFPFGPMLAIINNFFESHLDINRYIYESNRPFVVRSSTIGPWEKIIETLAYLGIIVNSICLPYISDGFYYVMQTLYARNVLSGTYYGYHQLIFILLYQNFLYFCGSLIKVMIPDVSESVRVGRLSEKFIHLQRSKEQWKSGAVEY